MGFKGSRKGTPFAAQVTCEDAAKKAMESGLKSVDEAYVRLGVANLNLGEKAEAIKAFQSVSSKSNLNRVAKLWIMYANKAK